MILSFRKKIEETAKRKNTPIVLAIDFPFEAPVNSAKIFAKAQNLLDAVAPYVCAVKINHHLVLPLGTFDGVQKLVDKIHEKGLMAIMDSKVNDIGNTNQIIGDYYFAAGFDAIIANPFVGWEEGLKPLFDISKKQERGVILLVYMSHKGSLEGYGQTIIDAKTGEKTLQYIAFAKSALKWGADGVVVGATAPEKIAEIKLILGNKVSIYSPGVGAQGGIPKIALKSGANYLIIGREITTSQDPAKAALKICEAINEI
jgi:orotidine-5'-phosphate decarboxylase